MVVNLTAEDVRNTANWPLVIDALREGHKAPRPSIGDTFVGADGRTMLVRSAFIGGLAAGVKAATVVPDNPDRQPPLPAIHAQIMLFDDQTGELTAIVDGTEVTAWKTAGDSALGCDLLARHDVETLLMIGAGAMAEPLIRAHLSVRPMIRKVILWNRSQGRLEQLNRRLNDLAQTVEMTLDLDDFVSDADVICCATMTNEPVLKGGLVAPGCHVDLVGAYKADMREADDELHRRGRWFVDSLETTLDHIGELKIPISEGLIDRDAVHGDLNDLVAGRTGRKDENDITVFKNGGGAHLDIMVSDALVKAHRPA